MLVTLMPKSLLLILSPRIGLEVLGVVGDGSGDTEVIYLDRQDPSKQTGTCSWDGVQLGLGSNELDNLSEWLSEARYDMPERWLKPLNGQLR